VEVSGDRADRTVAEPGLELGGCFDLETNPTTVAASVVGYELIIVRHEWQFSPPAIPILDTRYSIRPPVRSTAGFHPGSIEHRGSSIL
jgi:hypothetical protein